MCKELLAGLADKILDGKRISTGESEALYQLPLFAAGSLADRRRERVVPGNEVGYIVDRIVNYSNRCVAGCSFCAFHADAGRLPAYDLGLDEILKKIGELVAVGGTQVMLQGGLHPEHGLSWYLELLQEVRRAFPAIYLHSFSPAEIVHISGREGLSYRALIARMQEVGLDSIPGASDVLVDEVRNRVSPRKCTRDQWREVMHAIADEGMVSSATLTYGLGRRWRSVLNISALFVRFRMRRMCFRPLFHGLFLLTIPRWQICLVRVEQTICRWLLLRVLFSIM